MIFDPVQIACVLVFSAGLIAVGVIHETIRAQLIDRLELGERIGWRDFRSFSDWFGQAGLWKLHLEHFPASSLRFWFAASLALTLLAAVSGAVLQAYGLR